MRVPTEQHTHQPSLSAPSGSTERSATQKALASLLAIGQDGSLDPTEKALCLAIASLAVEGTTPTRHRLAECIGRTVFTVDRATKQLEERGLISVLRSKDPEHPGLHAPNTYVLLRHVPPGPGSTNRRTTSGRTPRSDSISNRVRLEVLERDGNRCLTCGTREDLTMDHVVPVSRGGSDTTSNLQTLCRPCNSRKGVSYKGAQDEL
uniref:Putative Stress protein n=1 Tax=Streptomyces sp. W75 TaxID=1170711 RepID=I0CEF0_9ACTN|nr:putative Stress protein [Streptomyces sp. W75]